MGSIIKIAGVQTNPIILDVKNNLKKCLEFTKEAATQGAKLVIFPEAALTGYCYSSLEEAIPVAETIPGPITEEITSLCKELNTYVIVGLIEKDGDKYYNASAFLGPDGLVGKYRKLHLPYLGMDRFLNHGDLPPKIYDTEIGRIGLSICFDTIFPELARVLTLNGADIVVNITNVPGPKFDPKMAHCIYARAIENLVFHIAVNRVGKERDWSFPGGGMAVNPEGKLIAEAKGNEEVIFYIEIDPAVASQKHQIIIPGQLEIDILRDRRPEFYGDLTKPLEDNSRIR